MDENGNIIEEWRFGNLNEVLQKETSENRVEDVF